MIRMSFWEDSYFIFFECDDWPGNRWRLWIPECMVFDADAMRSTDVSQSEWLEDTNTLSVRGEARDDEGRVLAFQATLAAQQRSIELRLDARNAGILPWSDYANLAVCLSNREAPDFLDRNRNQTFVVRDDQRLVSVAEALPAGESARNNHFPVGTRRDAEDRQQRFAIGCGYVARTSRDGRRTIAFAWDPPGRVDANYDELSCIHSHPAVGPLKPGESRRCEGLILLHDGDIGATWNQFPQRYK